MHGVKERNRAKGNGVEIKITSILERNSIILVPFSAANLKQLSK